MKNKYSKLIKYLESKRWKRDTSAEGGEENLCFEFFHLNSDTPYDPDYMLSIWSENPEYDEYTFYDNVDEITSDNETLTIDIYKNIISEYNLIID